MQIEALDYELPPDQIAVRAAEPRDAARLMVIRRRSGNIAHHRVADLADPEADLFGRGDLLIINRTQVLPARFSGTRRGTGGHVGGLYLGRRDPTTWEVMLEARGRLVPGDVIGFGTSGHLTLESSAGGGRWTVRVGGTPTPDALLRTVGSAPLPPYILRRRRTLGEAEVHADDLQRYNTVFADQPGSVAAPTASLHFTADLLERMRQRGVEIATVCLHVGIGTFAPIRTPDIAAHQIHRETIAIPAETIAALRRARAEGRRIVPIGTTAVRTVESLPDPLPDDGRGFDGTTDLYIHPDAVADGTFRFRFTDALMTNFHLPRSSLLALVAALPDVGIEPLLRWYHEAVASGYRFYSFGDAMLLL